MKVRCFIKSEQNIKMVGQRSWSVKRFLETKENNFLPQIFGFRPTIHTSNDDPTVTTIRGSRLYSSYTYISLGTYGCIETEREIGDHLCNFWYLRMTMESKFRLQCPTKDQKSGRNKHWRKILVVFERFVEKSTQTKIRWNFVVNLTSFNFVFLILSVFLVQIPSFPLIDDFFSVFSNYK